MSNLFAQQNTHTHGAAIAPITVAAKMWLQQKKALGKPVKLTKTELQEIEVGIERLESIQTRNGLNLSRIQIDALLTAREAGDIIEFETLGPYLAHYSSLGGVMTDSNLLPEDQIGLQLAKVLRSIFPKGRLVSLCDDYNISSMREPTSYSSSNFSQVERERFKASLVTLFKTEGVLADAAQEERDYLLLEESANIADTPMLIEHLESKGYIKRNGQEIMFFNTQAENPLHQRFTLRTKQGRWLCEALDAVSFVKPRNLQITHIVALPDYMRAQQDRVWEILRVLNIAPDKYHNIFYNPKNSASEISETIQAVFTKHQNQMSLREGIQQAS